MVEIGKQTWWTSIIVGALVIIFGLLWPIISGFRISDTPLSDNTPPLGPHHWEVGKGVS